MADLKIVLLKTKTLKDGTNKIRIALYHNHKTVYLVTRFTVKDTEFKDGRVVRRADANVINAKLRHLISVYHDKLDGLDTRAYDINQLKKILEGTSTEHASFKCISDTYCERLVKEGRKKYEDLLRLNERTFTEYCGDVLLKDITPVLIEGYKEYLQNKGLTRSSVGAFLARTRVIINFAIKNGSVTYQAHPFSTVTIPSSEVKREDISVEDFQRLMEYKTTSRKEVVALDIFKLSFYMGGINLIDMLKLDVSGNSIQYVRTKTRQTSQNPIRVELSIHKDICPIIKKYINKNTHRLDFGYKYSYDNFSSYITRTLREIGKKLGMDNVCFYTARASFGQYAGALGFPDSMIDYCLGHSTHSRGVMRYYSSMNKEIGDMVVSKVVEYTKTPKKFKGLLGRVLLS